MTKELIDAFGMEDVATRQFADNRLLGFEILQANKTRGLVVDRVLVFLGSDTDGLPAGF